MPAGDYAGVGSRTSAAESIDSGAAAARGFTVRNGLTAEPRFLGGGVFSPDAATRLRAADFSGAFGTGAFGAAALGVGAFGADALAAALARAFAGAFGAAAFADALPATFADAFDFDNFAAAFSDAFGTEALAVAFVDAFEADAFWADGFKAGGSGSRALAAASAASAAAAAFAHAFFAAFLRILNNLRACLSCDFAVRTARFAMAVRSAAFSASASSRCNTLAMIYLSTLKRNSRISAISAGHTACVIG